MSTLSEWLNRYPRLERLVMVLMFVSAIVVFGLGLTITVGLILP